MINTNLKIKNIFSIFLGIMFTLFAGMILVNANPDVTITAVTGAESISIDTTATGGTGA